MGVAIEVPLIFFVAQLLLVWLESPEAETTTTPEETTSGFCRPSAVGPRELKLAIRLGFWAPVL
jgi:hypothetical protein